jgi:alpha-amylase
MKARQNKKIVLICLLLIYSSLNEFCRYLIITFFSGKCLTKFYSVGLMDNIVGNGGENMQNKQRTILQGFEWYLPEDAQHWQKLARKAEALKKMGFTSIWLPPAYKGAGGIKEVGYATYDLYDLGEFDQKGSIPTKYGTKDEYLSCIKAMKAVGIEVYGDIVFDHFIGADEEESVPAVEYSMEDRTQPISEEKMISAWTKFTFPGRKGKYNDYIWTWRNFSGIDYDDRNQDHGIFNFANKGWDEEVDDENGNYDYLMGCDLDMEVPDTVEQLNKWGQWYQELTDIDGYRLDAVKHIQFNFFASWLQQRQQEKGSELFVVGEYWNQELKKLENYITSSGALISLFDVPLHYRFYEAATAGTTYDLRQLFKETLLSSKPDWAVTFVDNHDTQKGQSLESWVEDWFKLHAYAVILLRKAGTPVVFWGDLYGIPTQGYGGMGEKLERLIKVRESFAFGRELEYFDDPQLVGWTRTGTFAQAESGVAVVMSNGAGGSKTMAVGALHAGKTFVDILGNHQQKVVLDEIGVGTFPVNEGQVSVYVNQTVCQQIKAELKAIE